MMQCERTFVQLNRAGCCGYVWNGEFIATPISEGFEDLSNRWSWYWHLTLNEDAVLFEANFDKWVPRGRNVDVLQLHRLVLLELDPLEVV